MKGAGVRHKLTKCLLCKQDHPSSDLQGPSPKSREGNAKPVLLTQPWEVGGALGLTDQSA